MSLQVSYYLSRGTKSFCSLLEPGLSIVVTCGQEKKQAIQIDAEIAKILVLPHKDSKITVPKDTVTNTYDKMNKDVGNFCRRLGSIIIRQNKREQVDQKISDEMDLQADW